MAAVATPLSFASELKPTTDDESRQVFFRFVDGTVSHVFASLIYARLPHTLILCILVLQTMILDLSRSTRISEVKELLMNKAMATCSPSKHAQHKENASHPFLALLGLAWMASLLKSGGRGYTAAADLFLVSNGKLLEDRRMVADYHNLTLVEVSARIRGGCFMLSATVLATICVACIASTCTCGLSLVVIPFLLPLLFILPLFCL